MNSISGISTNFTDFTDSTDSKSYTDSKDSKSFTDSTDSESSTPLFSLQSDTENGNPFIYSNHRIHYNIDKNITTKTPMVLGFYKEAIPDDALLVINGKAYIENMYQASEYVEGEIELNLDAHSNIIIYVNSIKGAVTINLPGSGFNLQSNSVVIIKDVSLNFSSNSTYDIFIGVNNIGKIPSQNVYIEHYSNNQLVQSIDHKYILNTVSGSVTFRYVPPLIVGGHGVWMIQDQFIGNVRIVPNIVKIETVANDVRDLILNKK